MNNFLKRLYAVSGKVSLTKIGGSIVAAASSIVTLSMTHLIEIPHNLTTACIAIAFIGGKLTIDGFRDAVMKTSSSATPVQRAPALDARRQHLQEAAGGTSGWPHTEPTALDGTSIDPDQKQSESVPEKTVPIQNPPFEAGV